MIGIVIVAHGKLSSGLTDTLAHIVGEQAALVAVSIDSDKNPDENKAAIEEAISSADRGAGVVIVTDLHGSSPCNLAQCVAERYHCPVLFGVNVPMLIKLTKARHLPLNEALDKALAAGRKYMGIIRPSGDGAKRREKTDD